MWQARYFSHQCDVVIGAVAFIVAHLDCNVASLHKIGMVFNKFIKTYYANYFCYQKSSVYFFGF